MATMPQQAIDWGDTQGMVLRGYGEQPQVAYLVLRVDDPAAARAWIGAAAHRFTTGDRAAGRKDDCYLNIAFTRVGLGKLGLSEAGLNAFPTAFYEGMASPNRARILGDTGQSAPASWEWGGPGAEPDALLMIYAKDPATLAGAIDGEKAAMQGVTPVVEPLIAQLSEDGAEHFGFQDGISQPVIEGSPKEDRLTQGGQAGATYSASNVIKAGEFLLGYLNEYGQEPDQVTLPVGADPHQLLSTWTDPHGAALPDFGKNGTYLVARLLDQDVHRFWGYLEGETRDAGGRSRPEDRVTLGSKLIGRRPDGTPMALSPDGDDPALARANEFVYSTTDPQGFGCPMGSHIRRTNPRDSLGADPAEALKLTKRHRLLRRGRSYGPRAADPAGPPDGRRRGLFFVCLNANIERQFEFVQQTWASNPSFGGLYDQQDPILTHPAPDLSGSMTIPQHPIRRRIHGLGGFITVRGGGYFFLPGIRAIRYLASL